MSQNFPIISSLHFWVPHPTSSYIIPHHPTSTTKLRQLANRLGRKWRVSPFGSAGQRLWHEGVVPLRPSPCSATGLGSSWDHLGTILGCFASHLSGLAWRSSPIWMLRATSSRRMRPWLAMTGDDWRWLWNHEFPRGISWDASVSHCIPWYPSLSCLAS